MNKPTTTGLASIIIGLLILGFQAISSVMGTGMAWKQLNATSLVDPKNLAWIDSVSWFGIDRLISYLVTMPLFMLLIGLGVLLMIIGGFVSK